MKYVEGMNRKEVRKMLFNNKIKVRDRVRCLYNIEANNGYEFQTANKLGTIMVKENGEYGVMFDDFINGNSLISKNKVCYCKNGYGLWMKDYYFAKINQEEDNEELKEQLYKEFYDRVILDLKSKELIDKNLFTENINSKHFNNYDNEFLTIQEVFNCPNDTKFEVTFSDGSKRRHKLIKKCEYLEDEYLNELQYLSEYILNAKFKIIS